MANALFNLSIREIDEGIPTDLSNFVGVVFNSATGEQIDKVVGLQVDGSGNLTTEFDSNLADGAAATLVIYGIGEEILDRAASPVTDRLDDPILTRGNA